MTIEDVVELCERLDGEERSARYYNECRDRKPHEAAEWLDIARIWRGLIDCWIAQHGIEVEL